MTEFRYPRRRTQPNEVRNGRALELWLRSYAIAADDDGNVDFDNGNLTSIGSITADSLDLANQGSNPSASNGPDDYAEGYTMNILSSATGWPVSNGSVETWIWGTNRAWQVVRPKLVGVSYIRYWATSTTWSDWNLVESISAYGQTSTHYSIVSANTWEVAATATESGLPTSSFGAAVIGSSQCWAGDTAANATVRSRVKVSLDGGSTWTLGLKQIGEVQTGSSLRYEAFTNFVRVSGAVTGSIQAKLEVYSSQATSYFDDLEIMLQIGPRL